MATYEDWLKSSGVTIQYDDDGRPRYFNQNGERIRGGDDEADDAGIRRYYDSLMAPDAEGNLRFGTAGRQYVDDPMWGSVGGGNDWLGQDINGQQFLRTGQDLYSAYANDPKIRAAMDQAGGQNAFGRYDPNYGYLVDQNAFKQVEPYLIQANNGGTGDMLASLGQAALLGGMGSFAMGPGFAGFAEMGTAIPGMAPGTSAFSALFGGGQAPGGMTDVPWGVNEQGGNLFDWGGGLAEDAGLSASDWMASQVGAGGGDLASLFGGAGDFDAWLGDFMGDMKTSTLNPVGSSGSFTPSPSWLQKAASVLGGGNSPLGKVLGGNASGTDWMSLLGGLGSTALGFFGAKDQQDQFERMQDKYLALGAPHRARLEASYAPGFDLAKQDPAFQGALDQSSNAVLRGLSTKGNPFDNPGGIMEANKYVTQNVALPQLNTYRSQLGSFGQLGTNTAGTAGLNAAQSSGGKYDALGYGLSQMTQPANPWEDMMKQMGAPKLSLGWGA
jgi:hypothetical protein